MCPDRFLAILLGHRRLVGVQLASGETLVGLQEKNSTGQTRVLADSMTIDASALNHCATKTLHFISVY